MLGLVLADTTASDATPLEIQPIAIALLASALLVAVLLAVLAQKRRAETAASPSSPAAPSSPITPRFSGEASRWVSLWVGDFTDELELDGYLGRPFDHDHGTSPDGEGEYRVGTEIMPIETALADCYLAKTWAPAMAALARERGVETVTCVLVKVHYRHEERAPVAGPMRFVGSVAF